MRNTGCRLSAQYWVSFDTAFNNLHEQEALTARYHELCRYYGIEASRNNRGQSHENGAIESPHGHFKRQLVQALRLRGSFDFAALEDYQGFIDGVVSKINRRCRSRFQEEQAHLLPLPKRRTQDYAEHRVVVSSSSTFDLKRVTYSVPSRFIGERLYVQLYDERLELFSGHVKVLALPRVYAGQKERGRPDRLSARYRFTGAQASGLPALPDPRRPAAQPGIIS